MARRLEGGTAREGMGFNDWPCVHCAGGRARGDHPPLAAETGAVGVEGRGPANATPGGGGPELRPSADAAARAVAGTRALFSVAWARQPHPFRVPVSAPIVPRPEPSRICPGPATFRMEGGCRPLSIPGSMTCVSSQPSGGPAPRGDRRAKRMISPARAVGLACGWSGERMAFPPLSPRTVAAIAVHHAGRAGRMHGRAKAYCAPTRPGGRGRSPKPRVGGSVGSDGAGL